MNFSSTKPRDLLPGFLRGGLWGAAACQIEPRCKGVVCAEFFVELARKMGLYKKGRKHLSFRQKKSAPNKNPKITAIKTQQVAPLSG